MITLILVISLGIFGVFGCSKQEKSTSPPPMESDRFYRQGVEAYRAGALEEAAKSFQRCLRLAPDSVLAQVYMGNIRLTQGKRELSESLFDAIPAEERQRPQVQVLRARLLSWDGDNLQSEAISQKVLERHPQSLEARLQLARLSLQAAFNMDLERSRDFSRRILQQHPHYQEPAGILLKAILRLGEFSEAMEVGEQLSQTYPDNHLFPLLSGTAAFWKQDPAASEILKRAVDVAIDDYVDRLKALWMLKQAFALQGGYPVDLPTRYRFNTFRRPSPSTQIRFTDIGPQSGVDRVDRGRGSAWLDFDQDGDLDLFAVGIQVPHSLFRNDGGGRFREVTQECGLADPRGGWGSSAADFDNDGDLDLYVTRDAWEGRAPNSLYRNDAGYFTDVALEAGVIDSGSSFTMAWGDFDLDGYLDLHVANGIIGDGTPNSLFHNQQNGSFANVAAAAGVADTSRTIGSAFGDYDGDSLPDLYVVNNGPQNRLYHNNGDGTFSDVAVEAGVTFPLDGGYVTFFFDYNNDGELDLFAATMSSFDDFLNSMSSGRAIGANYPFLYHNNGDGTFSDVTVPAGLDRSFGTMGIGVGDINNDGFPDIYLANGGPEMSRLEPNILYLNQADGTFVDITETAGVGSLGKGHGSTFADFDGDGDMDLHAGVGGHYDGDVWANSLYRNDGPVGHYLGVETRGTTSNRDGIGARVALFSGAHKVYGQVASGYGFGTSNALPLHLGLGERTRIDRLEVYWPSGLRQSWEDIPADRVIRITEGRKNFEIVSSTP